MSLLVILKILRLFHNTLTVDDKHFLLNRDNLRQPIQMQFSQKQKTFSEIFFFFFPFLNSTLKFKPLRKKMTLIVDVFPEILASKNMVRQMSKKSCFRKPLDRKRGKWVETLLQSEWQHLYNIY